MSGICGAMCSRCSPWRRSWLRWRRGVGLPTRRRRRDRGGGCARRALRVPWQLAAPSKAHAGTWLNAATARAVAQRRGSISDFRLRFELAQIVDHALRALRAARDAYVAAMQYQPVVRMLFELFGDEPKQPQLDRQHVFAGRDRSAVGDAKYMGIDGDRRLAERAVQYHVGS